jgi:hypothetical protein
MDNSKIQIPNGGPLEGEAVSAPYSVGDHIAGIFKDRRERKAKAEGTPATGKPSTRTQAASTAANSAHEGAGPGGTATVTMETAHGNFEHSEGGVTNPSDHMAHMAGMFGDIASRHAKEDTAHTVFKAQEGGKIDRAGKRLDAKNTEAAAAANHGRSIEHLRAGADVARGFGSTAIHPTEGYKFENPIQPPAKKSAVDVHIGAGPKKTEPAAEATPAKKEPKLVKRDPLTGRAMKADAAPTAKPKKTPAAAKKPKK